MGIKSSSWQVGDDMGVVCIAHPFPRRGCKRKAEDIAILPKQAAVAKVKDARKIADEALEREKKKQEEGIRKFLQIPGVVLHLPGTM